MNKVRRLKVTKAELRTRVEAELLVGKEPRELSDQYGIPYVSILGWKKKLMAEKPEAEISDLTQQTKASLEIIREVAKEQAPVAAKKIDAIIDGVQGLKELEPKFHSALLKAVHVAQGFLDEVDDEGKTVLSIKEWQLITTTLSTAYGALFNKAGTVVNVAQTNVNAEQQNMAFFKSSQRGV